MSDILYFIKKEFLILFLLALFFIDPFEKGYYLCFALAFYFICTKPFSLILSVDSLGVILLIYSISYAIFYSYNPKDGTPYIWVYAISPITFYCLGRYFSNKYRSFTISYFLLLFLGLGYSLIPAISIVLQIIHNGYQGERDIKLLTRNELSGATLVGSYFTMNMAAIGTIFVSSSGRIKNRLKFITLFAFVISLLCVLRVASRTQLVIALISIVITMGYLMVKQSFGKNMRLLMILGILAVAASRISPDSSFLNILDQRNNGEERIKNVSGRTALWAVSLKNLTEKPFGWEMPTNVRSEVSPYSHNLWLDVDRIAGIIPFIFICWFTILCIWKVAKAVKVSPHDLYFNTTILVLFTGFMAVFFVEPVMEGMYFLFLIFCLFIGLLSGYVRTRFIEDNVVEV